MLVISWNTPCTWYNRAVVPRDAWPHLADDYPSTCPDLNPVNYDVWAWSNASTRRGFESTTKSSAKRWTTVLVIDASIDHWRATLNACVPDILNTRCKLLWTDIRTRTDIIPGRWTTLHHFWIGWVRCKGVKARL